MARIELSGDEVDTLRELLRTTLDELHSEISHTDDRDFHGRLKHRQATLEEVLRRLEAPA